VDFADIDGPRTGDELRRPLDRRPLWLRRRSARKYSRGEECIVSELHSKLGLTVSPCTVGTVSSVHQFSSCERKRWSRALAYPCVSAVGDAPRRGPAAFGRAGSPPPAAREASPQDGQGLEAFVLGLRCPAVRTRRPSVLS
jgi:hypothetical protein